MFATDFSATALLHCIDGRGCHKKKTVRLGVVFSRTVPYNLKN